MANNRYDRASVAKDTYFNTFVPLPLDQLTGLGMARNEELKRNQMLLDKAYDDALNIKYIKNSKDEQTVKGYMIPEMTKLAQKYSTVDLTNPIELNNMRRELRTKIDPTLVNRIQESYAGWQQAQAIRADLNTKGLWNEKLNDDPSTGWDSASGVYSWMPQAYQGREKILDPYFRDLKPSYKGINQEGMIEMSVDDNDIARIANSRAAELISTPAGQQELKLFKMDYPELAKNMSDTDIMNQLMRDYGEQKKQRIVDPLPEYMAKAYGLGATPKGPEAMPFKNLNSADVEDYKNLNSVTSQLMKLREQGNVEGAKDLEISLQELSKKYNVDLSEMAKSDSPWSGKDAFDILGNSGSASKNNQENVKKMLNELSSKTSTKYSFGYTSDQLGDVIDPVTGKKQGLSGFETLSSDLLANDRNYGLIEINGEPAPGPGSRKRNNALKYMNTDDLTSVAIESIPRGENEYKPVVTLGYTAKKDGQTTHSKIKYEINDETQAKFIANVLMKKGDASTAASVVNSHAAQWINTTNFDTPKTFDIITPQGQKSTVQVERNPRNRSEFNISFTTRDINGKDITTDVPAKSRPELLATVYKLLGDNTDRDSRGNYYFSKFAIPELDTK